MKVSAIVPAYNEAPRIRAVLDVLESAPCIDEIIVVDDGSVDGTKEAAQRDGVTVLTNDSRCGKGEALERGVRVATGDVLFFCDADLIGLSSDIIEEIIFPVSRGDVEMSIGARKSKVRHFGPGLSYSPLLDGQRALKRALWERVPRSLRRGYRVEVSLNYAARNLTTQVYDISQVTKEEKNGLVLGTIARWGMYRDVAAAHILNVLQSKRLFRFKP